MEPDETGPTTGQLLAWDREYDMHSRSDHQLCSVHMETHALHCTFCEVNFHLKNDKIFSRVKAMETHSESKNRSFFCPEWLLPISFFKLKTFYSIYFDKHTLVYVLSEYYLCVHIHIYKIFFQYELFQSIY